MVAAATPGGADTSLDERKGESRRTLHDKSVALQVSPDGEMTASVINLSCETAEGVRWEDNRLEMRDTEGILILAMDLPDFVVAHASWTPDSRFFVWSGYGGGGVPEPWHFPTSCFRRADNSILDLDVALGVRFTTGGFHVEAPDVLYAWEVFERGDNPPDTHRLSPVNVHLGALYEEGRSE